MFEAMGCPILSIDTLYAAPVPPSSPSMLRAAAYGFLARLFRTALAVFVPEIFGYTGTLNPQAIDIDCIILATASSIEYFVWCVGGDARSTIIGTPLIWAISLSTL